MSNIFYVLLSFLIVIAGGEEESPAAISKSPDAEERTGIHEDLNHNEDASTIRIHIIKEVEEEHTSRSEKEDEGTYRRSAERESPSEERNPKDSVKEEPSESKDGNSAGPQERTIKSVEEDEARSHDSADTVVQRVSKISEEITEVTEAHEAASRSADIEKTDTAEVEPSEVEGRSSQHVTLDIKGRQGDAANLEDVKAVPPEDILTFDGLKPLDTIIRKTLNNMIPHYYKPQARTGSPFNSPFYGYKPRPPYFGRLTNPEPMHSKMFEKDIPDNTIRSITQPEENWKFLEEYTDSDSNTYVYKPKDPIPGHTFSQNIIPLQQKLLEATNQQNMLSQFNTYSNENFNMNSYAPNFPYAMSRRFF